ncbi:hypothetical protein Tco_1527079, partial [Tanacetum coccineum]
IDKDDEDDDVDNQDDENTDYANQDDDDEKIESDNDSDDFVHPKLSTHDNKARQDDEVNEEGSDEESDDESNEDSDKEVQGASIKEKEMDEEVAHEEDEANALYRDVNVNLEGRDIEMTNAPLPNHSSSVSFGFIFNMLNPSPDTGIDSIFTLNTKETLLEDVSVTTIVEPPLLSATTLPPPPTPLITHQQQTLVPTPPIFNQTNQFAAAVSSILSIVDAYLANKMHEAVKIAVRLQSERLGDEAQAKNAYFLNKLDDNIKKIIKYQVKEQVKAQVSKILPKIEKTINEQLEAEVLTRSSNESKTSHAVAANLSELELKKILIDRWRAINTISFKRHRDDEDKDEEPSTGSNWGSKRKRAGKNQSLPSAQAEEPMNTAKDLEEPAHQEFETGVTEDQTNEVTFQHPDWFQKPAKPPTLDRDWNKTLHDAHGPV